MAECCTGGTKLMYSCSGNADVGEIADRVWRKLRKELGGKGTCLAGIAADLPAYIESAKGSDENIVIDGCDTACAKKALERCGVSPVSFVLTGMGLKKGETPPTEAIVAQMAEKIKAAYMSRSK